MFSSTPYNRREMIECLRDHVYDNEELEVLKHYIDDYIRKNGVDASFFCIETETEYRIELDRVPYDLLLLIFKFIMTLHVYDCEKIGGGRCN